MKKIVTFKKAGLVLALFVCFFVFAALGSSVFAEENGSSATLGNTENSVSIAQPYVVQEEVHYIDTIKVVVEWEVSDANAEGSAKKIWNSETLTWDVNSSCTEEVNLENSGMCTQVRITNLSSLPVEAKISYEGDQSDVSNVVMTKTNGENPGAIALDSWFEVGSVVNSDHSVDLSNEHEAIIALMSDGSENAGSGNFIVEIRCLAD